MDLRIRAIVLWLLCAGALRAQTGSIGGTITDQSGAVVPGAALTLTEVDRKLIRTTESDASGNYLLSSLPSGRYEMKAEHAGFKTFLQSGLTLEVDQRTRLDVALQVGAVGETVSVTSELPLVTTESTTVGGVVENRRIVEMPLNGRFFLDLANLLPGTVHSSNPRTFLASGTAAGAFAFNAAGAREDQINYLVEGINLNDMVQNQLTFQPNIEFIQEFKIQVNSFSAELGRSSGAVVNAVMRSGTNGLHGDAYEFLRNDVLDARNFFDPPRPVAKARTGRELPPFKRNIFGAAVGGPVWIPGLYDGHDRTFFFATYEGRRQRESETFTARVPTAAERAGVTDPIVRNVISLLPPENAALPNNFVGSAPKSRTLDQATGKVDQRLGGAGHFAVTYVFQRDSRVEPSNIGAHNIPGHGDFRPARRQFFSINETRLAGPHGVNEFRFGLNRVRIAFVGITTADAAAVGLNTRESGPGSLPDVTVPGLLSFGNPNAFPQGRADTTFQFTDIFSLQRSSHALKFGVEARRFWNNNFNTGVFGSLRFDTMADFLAGRVSRFTKPAGDISPALRVWAFNWFVQDDWRVRPGFTVSLGMRYEFNGVPSEIHDRLTLFDPATASLHRVGDAGFDRVHESDNNNFGPRVGFAWDPFGQKRTAIRGAYGIFFNQPVTNIVTALGNNPPFRTTVDYDRVTVANLFGAAGAARAPVLSSINRNFTSDYVQQWNLNIQQELMRNTRLEVSYLGSKGTHLRLVRDINPRAPSPTAAGLRPFPAFGRINQSENSSSSNYHGLWASVERRVARGLLFTVNHSWSKSIDINSVGSSNPQVQDPLNLRAERALSDFDARHRFSFSFVYEFPFRLTDTPAVARRVLTGWQLTGIGVLQSGSPVAPILSADRSGIGDFFDRPNIVVSQLVKTGPNPAPEHWWDPAQFAQPPFGQFGNAGRNILLTPNLKNFDLGLYKNTRFTERVNLQFRAQFYNIFNHTNLGAPVPTFPANFGVIRNTRAPRGDASSSRQIEFGMKLYW
jgi:hypothetical protein